MARKAIIILEAIDYESISWDIREKRDTPHGWAVMLGWPSSVQRGVGGGGPRVMIDGNLKHYLDEMRFDPGFIDLPIGWSTIKRLRRDLGHNRYKDRPLWWASRKDDLLNMTLTEFCKKHDCSIGAASQARKKYKNEEAL